LRKIGLLLVLAVLFFVTLFPFADLNDWISAQIADASGNQIFIEFEDAGIDIIPNTGLNLSGVSLDTPSFGPLKISEITLLPSIGGLIRQTPSGRVKMRGVLEGDLDLSLSPGKTSEAGNPTYSIKIQGESLVLNDLGKIAQLPVNFKGKLSLKVSGSAEPTFSEQPDMDITLKIDQLQLPPSTIDSQMGPINLPALRISQLELQGRLSAGRLNIEKAQLGKAGDDISGSLKGGVNLTVMTSGGGFELVPGAYSLEADLMMTPDFEARARGPLSFLFLLLDNYKSSAAGGFRFAFKASASNPQMPPSITALR
jgi:type II secretion system protein N